MGDEFAANSLKTSVPESFYDLFAHIMPSLLLFSAIVLLFVSDKYIAGFLHQSATEIWLEVLLLIVICDIYGQLAATVANTAIKRWLVPILGARWLAFRLFPLYSYYYFLQFHQLPDNMKTDLCPVITMDHLVAQEGPNCIVCDWCAKSLYGSTETHNIMGFRHHELMLGFFRHHRPYLVPHLLKKYARVKVARAMTFNAALLTAFLLVMLIWSVATKYIPVIPAMPVAWMRYEMLQAFLGCMIVTTCFSIAFFRRQAWWIELLVVNAHRIMVADQQRKP